MKNREFTRCEETALYDLLFTAVKQLIELWIPRDTFQWIELNHQASEIL